MSKPSRQTVESYRQRFRPTWSYLRRLARMIRKAKAK